MMKEIINSLKLIKYAYNLKITMISSILFLAVGALLFFDEGSSIKYLGIIYILLAPYMLIQLHYSLIYSNLVAASGNRRIMELTVPNIMTGVSTIAVYALQMLLAAIVTGITPAKTTNYINVLIWSAILVFVVVVYYGACYKNFVIGTALFVVAFVIVHALSMSDYMNEWLGSKFAGNLVLAEVVGFSIVVVGLLISCLLRKMFYKKDLAPLAMGAALRKAMQ